MLYLHLTRKAFLWAIFSLRQFLMARNSYIFQSITFYSFLLTEHASSRGWGLDIRDLKRYASQDPFNICRHLQYRVLHLGEVLHAGNHEDACYLKKKDLWFQEYLWYYFIFIFVFFLNYYSCLTNCRLQTEFTGYLNIFYYTLFESTYFEGEPWIIASYFWG